MKELSRKEKEKLQRKSYIMDAAAELFSEQGYDDTTIDEIAEKAEFSKGSIYQYFSSKEEIYITIYDDLAETMASAIFAISTMDLPPDEKIKKTIFTGFEQALKSKKLAKILLQREGHLLCAKESITNKVDKKMINTYRTSVEEGIKQKIIKINEPQILETLIEGMIIKSISTLIQNDSPEEDYIKYAEIISKVFLQGCC